VVFKTEGLPEWGEDRCVVFRVAGLPGERVRIEPPWLIVNGERVTDPPIFATIAAKEQGYAGFLSPRERDKDPNRPSKEIVLGDDEYFVLGDNTRDANDSRYQGPVTGDAIVGRVTRIYWPFGRIHALDGKW
jgi:signal peptidase I